jgi:uncharacterized protein with von Willebrand factor type A (vWA) domain
MHTRPLPDSSTDSIAATGGHLLANLLHFGRLLRNLDIQVSTRQINDLAASLNHIDISSREDFFYAASGFLVHRPEQLEIFQRAFDLFWSGKFEVLLELGLAYQQREKVQPDLPESDQPVLEEDTQPRSVLPEGEGDENPIDESRLAPTYSPVELLVRKDFAEFNDDELEQAKHLIQDLFWHLGMRRSRREVRAIKRAHSLDMQRAIRLSMKQGGEIFYLPWRRRKLKPRPLIVICDISGSMERYSRLFLHFMYSLVQSTQQTEVFVFGTRLTRLTHALRHSDVDSALDKLSSTVLDWSGGTRIGESLKKFNYSWLRRVHGRGAMVVIISDGWDRGDIDLLETEISRLQRSVYRLVWLNPLLGSPDYEPLVRGIQIALPYVDAFLPVHNLVSLEQLTIHLENL